MNNYAFILNILVHIFILFSFLVTLFFTYISKVEVSLVKQETENQINESIPKILSKLREFDKEKKIDWGKLDKFAIKMRNDAIKEGNGDNDDKNKKLFYLSLIIVCSLFTLILVYIIIAKFFFNKDLNLKEILLENLVIFSLVGMIEFLFFQKIASKYVPVVPSVIVTSILDEVEVDVEKLF